MDSYRLLFVSLLILLSACSEDDDFDARKDPSITISENTTLQYRGSITKESSSDETCPEGTGSFLVVNFDAEVLQFTLTENDEFEGFNSLLNSASTDQSLSYNTRSFDKEYSLDDSSMAYDTGDCDSNGGYSGAAVFSINGSIESDYAAILDAPYRITLVCNDEEEVIACSGNFTGVR